MPAHPLPRRRTDRLSPTRLTPSAKAALDLITTEPGISVAELGERLGVSRSRTWELVSRLEYGRVHRHRAFATKTRRKRTKPK